MDRNQTPLTARDVHNLVKLKRARRRAAREALDQNKGWYRRAFCPANDE